MVIFNPKESKNIRRKLRQQPIACERILWQKIRNNQLGFKFRRQVGISGYVADFYCPSLKLVIEIDGATHGSEQEIEHDKRRQTYFENLNITVKRYLNVDIKNNLKAVLADIEESCRMIKDNQPHP